MAYSCKHKIVSGLVCAALIAGTLCTSSHVATASQETETDEAAVEEMVRQMTLDEKMTRGRFFC